MEALDIILKKRNGLELTKEELTFFINGYVDGSVKDYQMSAFLMATYFEGMTDDEATNLALIMEHSGDVIDLSNIKGFKVDKHSTGGVGDKTSLVLAPLVASLGVKFAKMSGRGLGHTGGTLDKLESIPGFNISLSKEEFVKQVNDINIAIIGQTGSVCPADKKMYALRDVTGTVDSIPLIASSIMSKKLAAGADAICLDVKVGSGAFMKTAPDALKLANLMVSIGKRANKKMTAILTNMDEPLGKAIGNSLEVKEAIATLNGEGPKDLEDLCLTLGSYLVLDSGKAESLKEARQMLEEQIKNKQGLKTLAKMVEAQGGNSDYIYHPELFLNAKEIIEVKAKDSGYISRIDSYKMGHASMLLGAGRENLDTVIDPVVGIVLNKKVDDFVNIGDTLAYIHTNGKNTKEAIDLFYDSISYSDKKREVKLILDVVR